MANYASSNCLSNINHCEYKVESTVTSHASDEIQMQQNPNDCVSNLAIKASPNSYVDETLPERSPCSNEDCCAYRENRFDDQKKTSSLYSNRSIKVFSTDYVPTVRDMSNIRQRRRTPSSPSESEASSRGMVVDSKSIKYECLESKRNRRTRKSPSISRTSKKSKTKYIKDDNRMRNRMIRTHKPSVSPQRVADKDRSRAPKYFNKSNERELIRRRPRTPPTPDKKNKSKEKVPYFADTVRERDRLRKKYKSPSPVVTSSRQRYSKSRTPRRCRSRSRPRSYSRSRSRSRHRTSELDYYRRKRDKSPYETWPAAPQIITIPVPVPDYSFAFPPSYHPPSGWPHLPVRPARLPFYPHHRDYNNRHVSLPPIRFLPPYGYNGVPLPNTMPPNRPPRRDLYRYPYT